MSDQSRTLLVYDSHLKSQRSIVPQPLGLIDWPSVRFAAGSMRLAETTDGYHILQNHSLLAFNK